MSDTITVPILVTVTVPRESWTRNFGVEDELDMVDDIASYVSDTIHAALSSSLSAPISVTTSTS